MAVGKQLTGIKNCGILLQRLEEENPALMEEIKWKAKIDFHKHGFARKPCFHSNSQWWECTKNFRPPFLVNREVENVSEHTAEFAMKRSVHFEQVFSISSGFGGS